MFERVADRVVRQVDQSMACLRRQPPRHGSGREQAYEPAVRHDRDLRKISREEEGKHVADPVSYLDRMDLLLKQRQHSWRIGESNSEALQFRHHALMRFGDGTAT